MLRLSQRIRLANFFERLATIGVSSEEWQQYMVTHYSDSTMERARSSVVRLTLHCFLEKRLFSNNRLLLQKTDTELCSQIQAIAAAIFKIEQVIKALAKEEWWLDWSISGDNQFTDVVWARVQVFSDLSAEVFDMDGRTIYFEDETLASNELSEDEYRRFKDLDEEDEQDLGVPLVNLEPPVIKEKQNLQPLMKVRFQRELQDLD